jgi:hypothetical protein
MILLCGDKSRFAIESGISQFHTERSLLGLGYFVIHMNGVTYGVKEPDATALACSHQEVMKRLALKGIHRAEFGDRWDSYTLAYELHNFIYNPAQENDYLNMSIEQIKSSMYGKNIMWAPDGDEAFDDGGHIIQFDLGDRVRIVAWKSPDKGYAVNPKSVQECYLPFEEYYQILEDWSSEFFQQWELAQNKMSGIWDPSQADSSADQDENESKTM